MVLLGNRVPLLVVAAATTALACSVCTFGGAGLVGDVFTPVPDSAVGPGLEAAPAPELNHAPVPESAYETLAALSQDTTTVPPRDRLDLAERLRGLSPDEIDLPAPKTYQLGDEEVFWASNSDTDEPDFQVVAALEYMTPHVYMWVEKGADFDPDALARAAERFETQTYPIDREYFGSEWSPGIDGDVRLHVLHAHGIGDSVAGYFSGQSEYPEAAVPYSNQREMFFINIGNTRPGDPFYDGVLAHEFQHMIHWNVDRNEDSWVNEGLSELAVLLNGLEVTGFEYYFVVSPDLRLTDWPEVDSGTQANYGASFLFHTYFLERFGEEVLRALVRNPRNGLEGMEDTLADEGISDPLTGQPITLEDFFADWVVANYANDPALGDGRYAYTLLPNFQTAAPAEVVDRLPAQDVATVNQFGADYVELPAADRMRVAFDGSTQVRIMDTDTVNTDGDPATDDRFVWWSNRGDDSDMRLTLPLDLSDVSSATLEYDAWYFIEENWDFAYVMVSSDEGRTWDILETPHSSTFDPHGTGYGPGYTGASVNQPGANAEGWLHEALDLSAYAGREVLLRFEMITDDAVNQPGLLVDNVRVDAAGFYDDVEGGEGQWEAQGFLRHDNVLPQAYIVQVLVLGDSPRLERLQLDASNQGELALVPGPGADRVVLVVSGATPYTGEVASYHYSVTEE